jgi:hypothetical protein
MAAVEVRHFTLDKWYVCYSQTYKEHRVLTGLVVHNRILKYLHVFICVQILHKNTGCGDIYHLHWPPNSLGHLPKLDFAQMNIIEP